MYLGSLLQGEEAVECQEDTLNFRRRKSGRRAVANLLPTTGSEGAIAGDIR